MKFLVRSKLSEHRYKTPEGYLVCVDSILSRTGKQTYSRDELFKDGSTDEVEVDRSAEEVFSEKTLASFENKPLTIEHPEEDVTPANHNKYSVGFIRDIKRGKDGSEDVMLGTIVVTDAEAIELIETGKLKELSCGYDCDIEDEDNPQQRNIRGNHVALCEKGRAGIARIIDSIINDESLKRGKTYVAASGAKLTVDEIESGYSDYNGEPYVTIHYSYVSASGKRKGKSKCSSYDFWSMMTDKSKTGDSVKDALIKTISLSGSIQRGDIGKLQLNLVNAKSCWISIEGLYQDDKSGLIDIRGRSECVLVKKNGGLTVNVRYIVEKANSRIFEKIEHRVETSIDFWKDDVVDFIEKTYDKVLNSVKAKDSCKDSIKDATFEVWYVDRHDNKQQTFVIAADQKEARQKVQKIYGPYRIYEVRKVKDGVKDMKVSHDNIREQPVFIMQSDVDKNLFFYIGKTHAMKEGEWTYTQYDMEGMTPDELRKELEANGWHKVAKGPAPFIDEAPIYAVKARYEGTVLEWYVRANSEQEAFDKIKRQPGHNYDKFVSAKIVEERAGMHIIDEDPYEESTEGLEEAEKNLHDEMICNAETDCKDELQTFRIGFDLDVTVDVKATDIRSALEKAKSWAKAHNYDDASSFREVRSKGDRHFQIDACEDASDNAYRKVQTILSKNPQFKGKINKDEFDTGEIMIDFADYRNADKFVAECRRMGLRCREGYFGPDTTILVRDAATNDAKTEYIFNYRDTYHGTRDKMRVDANNLDEAIREFGNIMALGGFGTANIYVVSVSPNDGYMRAYGKLSEMLKQKWTKDSVKKLDSKKLLSIVKAAKSIKK